MRENGGVGTENKKHKWYVKIDSGRLRIVKNSMGNGEAKELICTTHGDEECRWGGAGQRGIKGEIWGNCNSIVNKMEF